MKDEYDISLSYGSVVQLCAVRNRRRISAKRYRGVARITCRRARKGFDVKFNPDSRWSYCFTKDLTCFRIKDGSNKMILNRDDQAGFRLDSTFSHKTHKAVCLTVSQGLTTHSDYINKHGGQLQTSSYVFLETENTGQVPVGVVKEPGVLHDKSPSQHLADLYFLKEKTEMDVCFDGKAVDCIRVDGGADEGPSILEVQFRWTEWYLKEEREFTIVTIRNNGASCFNLVELQNGIISRAHANLFIPSTMCGSSGREDRVSQEKLKENIEAALGVYLDRVDNIPFESSVIQMYIGPTQGRAQELKEQRDDFLTFLRGKKSDKEQLQKMKPDLYQYSEHIWKVRNVHMLKDLPTSYVFALKVCYKDDCQHPVCKKGIRNRTVRFQDGSPIEFLPFPLPDPNRPWGAKDCEKCDGICRGHCMVKEIISNPPNPPVRNTCNLPPSTIIRAEFIRKTKSSKGKGQPDTCLLSSEEIKDLAKKTLLSFTEVEM